MKSNDYQSTSILLSLLAAFGCGTDAREEGTEDPAATAHSYQTTSNVGDLSTWTIDGNKLSVEWKDIAPITGAIEKTYFVTAVCGSIDPDFGDRTCLVDGDALCTDGVVPCEPNDGPQNGETFTIFEVPGMALIANVENEQLHAGFAAGACDDMPTDDYTFINLGLGQKDIFGLFRTDSAFSLVHHLDFGFTDDPENQIAYTTGDDGGTVAGITASACQDGVRELVIDATSDTLRMMITGAGHFIIDKPEGQGGLIAVNAQNIATIEDFANRSFGGIAFPDDRAPELINATMGPAVNGRVEILSLELSDTGVVALNGPTYINDSTAGANLSAPMLEPRFAYADNQIVIDGSYTQGAASIPGMFEIDKVSGNETAIIGVGASLDGKTMLFGTVVNQYEGTTNGVKGNFILIEK